MQPMRPFPVPVRLVTLVGPALAFLAFALLAMWAYNPQDASATPYVPGVGSSPTPTPTCEQAWEIVPSPNAGIDSNDLKGVAVISPSNIWAVGAYKPISSDPGRTLAMHWDGTQWTISPTPNVGSGSNYLDGVAALSQDEVWAVGDYLAGNRSFALIMRWDGTQWSIVPSPSPSPAGSSYYLNAVDAIAANDVWAVGTRTSGSTQQTLALHWDGTQWSVVPSPNPGQYNGLSGLAAISSDDIWAVGSAGPANGAQTLTMHWDGVEWIVVPSPSVNTNINTLKGVAALSTDDVWAVGYYWNGTAYRTLALRWDGSQWAIVPTPDASSESNTLQGVAALSQDEVWAVGYYAPGSNPDRTLTMHWDGGEWSIVPSPSPASGPNYLMGVAADAQGKVWAVGGYAPFHGETLVLRYPRDCATPSPTPTTPSPIATATLTASPSAPTSTGTSTPASPTPMPTTTVAPTPTGISTATATAIATATPATSTATATPTTVTTTATAIPTATQCALQFSDVPTTSTFYANIRCLACRGILGGYSDGTFRPSNDITRGQIAKVVSNAAGFNEDPGTRIYEDVPPAQTFYEWINRLSRRGHMGGYPCGGAGEPCGSGGMPYFRPSASATRGQLAKIVASAASLTGTPTGHRYADVEEESTFYVWIEQLSSLGVMGGYPCGTLPTEPCDGQNRAYFRPFINVTRGQASKIVANTFFPGCNPAVRR